MGLTKTGKWCGLLLVLAPAAMAGDMYKWQDENGLWHFSDLPPQSQQQEFDTFAVMNEPRQMLTMRKAGPERQPSHVFFNHYYGDAEVELQLLETVNVQSDPALPARFVMAGQSEQQLVSLSPGDETRGFSYRLSYQMVPGPPSETLPDDLDFFPPFPRGRAFPISQGIDDAKTHKDPPSQYAVDIVMPEGTPVLAARGGLVMDVEDNFHEAGKQEARYLPRANQVRILHEDGSMAQYAHLQANSVQVRPGQRVEAGRWIGNSGNTGYSSGPHLHFVIQQNVGMALESLPFRFRTMGGVMDPDRPQMLAGVLAGP
jgi:murein DD-endopeptidase MepM/ murein hydrolase activator NlpD